jgi:hypothetical protein
MELVLLDQLNDGIADLIFAERQIQAIDLRRLRHTFDVILQPEDEDLISPLVSSYSFKDPRPIMERMREYMHGSLFPRYELAIHPNEIRRDFGHMIQSTSIQQTRSGTCFSSNRATREQ